MKQLTIEHNHGVYVLADAEVIDYPPFESGGRTYMNRVARGTVIDGGVTNRLFHCTSYTPELKGAVKEYNIWKSPYCVDTEKDHWYVSSVTCG